jgi:hypothetical protein
VKNFANSPKESLFITSEKLGVGPDFRIGNNIPQRFFYIDFLSKTVAKSEQYPEFLNHRKIEIQRNGIFGRFVEILIKSLKYEVIVTERNIFGIIGFINKIVRGVTWIVDPQDCPFRTWALIK